MSRSLNKVMLIGNVGAEPEIRSTASGTRVAKLSLATNRTFSDRAGQQQEKTEWHRLTFFGKIVDVIERYVHKGDRLYVDGRIEYSQTQDEQGNVKYWTDIVVGDMVMLGAGGQDGGGGGGGGAGAATVAGAAVEAVAHVPAAERAAAATTRSRRAAAPSTRTTTCRSEEDSRATAAPRRRMAAASVRPHMKGPDRTGRGPSCHVCGPAGTGPAS